MRELQRYLANAIVRDLRREMVFLAGAREVGKTTLVRSLPDAGGAYLDWEVVRGRERILRREMPRGDLWILDEVHKYRSWRRLLKRLDDGRLRSQRILVAGSARLDACGYGGDSLRGRYHLLRLHPLSVAELGLRNGSELRDLLTLGGFPEPWFGGSAKVARRWSREYRSRLVREEIAVVEGLRNLGGLELLFTKLPALVGSPLSLNALRLDLQVGHKTVGKWIEILEKIYAVFRVAPFSPPGLRALRKEQKHYHLDWSAVPTEAPRFENLVAVHLLKWVHYENDARRRDLELRYFRDAEKREVDFVVVERRKPLALVEVKWGDQPIDPSLGYMKKRFPKAEAWQISATGSKDYVSPEGIRVAPALVYLKTLV